VNLISKRNNLLCPEICAGGFPVVAVARVTCNACPLHIVIFDLDRLISKTSAAGVHNDLERLLFHNFPAVERNPLVGYD